MLHRKRFFWLLAWSMWVFLGLGLHRELPRNLELVCKLPLESRETVVGFLHGEPIIVTKLDTYSSDKPLKINLRDATTGAILKCLTGPVPHHYDFSLRHGVVVGNRKELPECVRELPADFRQVLNLRTGEWTVLGGFEGGVSFHSQEPLAAFQIAGILGDAATVLVFHLHSGAKVFEWKGKARQGEVRDEVRGYGFSEQDDEVLILRSRLDYKGWPIPNSNPKVLEHELLHCSLTGRVTSAVAFAEPCEYIRVPPCGGRI